MSEASFRKREPQPSDALVCQACGGTLGERRLADDEVALSRALVKHKPECKARLQHQATHRNIAGPCPQCRGKESNG